MKVQRWYPSAEANQVLWLTNYRNKIQTHGPTCGLGAPELADTDVDLALLIWLLETWNPAIQQDAQEATAYKRLIAIGTSPELAALPLATVFSSVPALRPPGVLNRLFNQIARMKKNAGFTEAIGLDLGVMGGEDTAVHPAPEFSLMVEQGTECQCVRVEFTKFNHQGVYLECRRNNGAWTFVGIDTEKPYIHDVPLLAPGVAETREYRLRFWDKGEPNGDWSPVQKVTVGA